MHRPPGGSKVVKKIEIKLIGASGIRWTSAPFLEKGDFPIDTRCSNERYNYTANQELVLAGGIT